MIKSHRLNGIGHKTCLRNEIYPILCKPKWSNFKSLQMKTARLTKSSTSIFPPQVPHLAGFTARRCFRIKYVTQLKVHPPVILPFHLRFFQKLIFCNNKMFDLWVSAHYSNCLDRNSNIYISPFVMTLSPSSTHVGRTFCIKSSLEVFPPICSRPPAGQGLLEHHVSQGDC